MEGQNRAPKTSRAPLKLSHYPWLSQEVTTVLEALTSELHYAQGKAQHMGEKQQLKTQQAISRKCAWQAQTYCRILGLPEFVCN